MHIELIRLQYHGDRTLGTMHIVGDDRWFCDTLEPPIAINGVDNVRGKCCIPPGTYNLRVTWSPAFRQWLPLIEAVPGRSGIRIHAGNKPAHTKGCILVGELDHTNRILMRSQPTLQQLMQKLNRYETHTITII